MASQEGHKSIVMLILNKGASTNIAIKSNGKTPLIIICSRCHKAIMLHLPNKGVDPNLVIKNGETPLFN